VLWANVHGSVVLAPVLLGYAWLDDLVRHRATRASLLVLLAGTVATVVTPFGPGVWAYALGIGADQQIAGRVSEWQRTTPFTVEGVMFYGSAAVALVVAAWGRARLSLADWLWLATLLVIGVWAVRGLAWWPAGAVLVLAAALPSGRAIVGARPARRSNGLNAAVSGMLAVAIVLALPWLRPTDPLAGRSGILTYAPSGLAAALREQAAPGARVFVPQTWASWFEWAAPQARYFLDSRFELYPADVWRDYDAIAGGGPDAAAALDRWSVDLVVVGTTPPTDLGPGWVVAYQDESGAFLVQDSSTTR